MDLIKEYMKKQGTLGYLHSKDVDSYKVALAYADEGARPEYYYCTEEEADRIIEHWGATGELIIQEFEHQYGFMTRNIIKNPSSVRVMKVEKAYIRKSYPQHGEQPW